MRRKQVSVLLLLGCLCAVGMPLMTTAQEVTSIAALNQNNTCTLPGAEVFPGGIYRHRDETIYYRCWRILGRDAQPAGLAWIPGEMRNATFFLAEPKIGGQCSRPGNLRYSVGAVVNFGGSTYRCSDVFGQELKTSTVAWVEVEVRDTIPASFVIKGLP